MPLRNSKNFIWKPSGTVDSADGMNIPPGGMRSLTNLVFDPTTPYAFLCRPAMTSIEAFGTFTTPGDISVAIELNGYVYGLIASGLNSGKDQPFVYDIATSSFLTVSGITSSNVPTTQASTGDWTPPTIVAQGGYIAVTHPGFNGTNGYFGFFDISGFTITDNGDIASGSNIISGDYDIIGIQPGYTITGTGIPAGTVVTNVANISTSTTGNTNTNTSLTSVVAYIPIGSQITGVGIPSGTYITARTGSAGNYTYTISQAATATATGITIYIVETQITMSQNATATTDNLSITIAGGSLASPLWCTGNATMNGLSGVPTNVNILSGRFYFSVKNYLEYTDTLSFNRTSAAQSLTAGDSTSVTALSLFSLGTTSQGMLQTLLAFKANSIYQVTGDAALSNLAINAFNTAAGTIAPRSVVATPSGVFFRASDGIRVVNPLGNVSEPNADLRSPFINALYPSRISAGYNTDVYRISVQNSAAVNTPWQEYWYDISRNKWTGPHTCQQDFAIPYGSSFLCGSHLNTHTLFLSDVIQTSSSSFTEYGSLLNWIFETATMSDDNDICIQSAIETTLNLTSVSGEPPITVVASDENTGVLSQATLYPPTSSTVWGGFVWGASIWFGLIYGIRPHLVPWTNPLVFTKLVFKATGSSITAFKVSNLKIVAQQLFYYPPV